MSCLTGFCVLVSHIYSVILEPPLTPELCGSMQLAKRISPSMEIGPLSAPFLLVPVMAMAQVVNVSRSGEEPDPAGSVPEDVRLHDSSLADSEGDASRPCLPHSKGLDVRDLAHMQPAIAML